ncbi:hypothetical protein NHX12_002082 [Muraenolepis orangiensis]|uniref:Uncharacterized protein n=1 Tax=Muraenolepis orangiensis TaxID=630683 RepID=A0A9Q0IHV3_9TELE|nr:hypothetical protein NHX12_002082 [Muraenolepis orangiensis]
MAKSYTTHQRKGKNHKSKADRTVRLKVCLETLVVNQETMEGVPPPLRLPVAVTCYWLRRPKPDLKLLKALLMVMIQGELNRQEGLTTGRRHL